MIAADDQASGPETGSASGCPRCGYGDAMGARFCSECGLRLAHFCWSCGGLNRVDANFCRNCGTQLGLGRHSDAGLAGAFGAAALRPGRPSSSIGAVESGGASPSTVGVPSPNATQAVDRGQSADGTMLKRPAAEQDEERRVVTVVFADIVGFTTLSERLDPEDARKIVAAAQGKLVEAVALYGGTVDKLMGDAVMALFGAPTAHADDPVRAVHAGLAMIRAMEGLGDGQEPRLALRVGINTGEVVAGARDVGGYREYSVYGDVVNTAARLQTAAEPGGILLGETTARSARDAFRLEPTAPLALKGKEQMVQAFRVVGATQSSDGAMAGGRVAFRAPLVGRLAETRKLRERLQELARGRGGIVSVIGEHGVGKSRLVDENRPHAERLGLRWAAAHAPAYGQNLGYRMFRETIGELFGIEDDAPDDVARARLWEGLQELEVGQAYPYLAFVLGLPRDPETEDEFRRLGAEGGRRRAFAAVREFFVALAARQPLVLVLENLQWADPSSVDLLEELMALSDEVPILFCYAFTPDRDAPSWGLKELAARAYPHRYTELLLGPLSGQAAHELVCGLLDCAEAPPRLEEMVLAKSDGNPYFVEEVLRALIDEGALRRVGDRWVAERDIREVSIPDTLMATVMARIDRLPEGVRRTLQIAAIIGREFSERLLQHVVGGGRDLERQLREAQRAGLIREEATIPERRYAFSQAMIREAALSCLLLRRRKELHVQVGWALEELFADDLADEYGALAGHFYEGEDWERAFRYGRLAGEQAAAAYANEEAVANYTMALDAAERSAAGADPEIVAELVERRSDVQALVGEYEEALSGYTSALHHHQEHQKATAEGEPAHLQEGVRVGQIALKLAQLHSLRIDLPELQRALDVAFANLPADSPDSSLAWSLQSVVHVWRTEVPAGIEAARRGMALARNHGSPQHLNAAYQSMTQPAIATAIGGEGRVLADEWIALARERGDPKTVFRALTARVFAQIWGFWSCDDRDLAKIDEAARLARTLGSPAAEYTVRALRGAGYFLRGRWDEAERELRSVDGRPTSVFGLDVISQFWLTRLLAFRGRLEEARAIGEAILAGPHNPHTPAHQHTQLAINRALAGDSVAARASIERAGRAMDSVSCGHCGVFFHAAAAELYAELGDDAAIHHAARARTLGTELHRKQAMLAAERAEALIDLRAARFGQALERLQDAEALAREIDQRHETARTAHLLGRAYHAAGEAERARDRLDLAARISGELKAEPDLAAVRATMQELGLRDGSRADRPAIRQPA